MSRIDAYLSASVTAAKGVGSPDATAFPYNASDPGNAEMTENANNVGDITYAKNADGDHTISVDSASGGDIAIFSIGTISI